jgi:hypothetical protein
MWRTIRSYNQKLNNLQKKTIKKYKAKSLITEEQNNKSCKALIKKIIYV